MSDFPVGDDYDDDLDEGVDPNRKAGATATDVLDYVVRQIVDDPDAVEVEAEEGRRRVTLQVHVGPADMGRVIGRRGRTANAIRAVVRAAAARDGIDVDVDFAD